MQQQQSIKNSEILLNAFINFLQSLHLLKLSISNNARAYGKSSEKYFNKP